MFKEILKIIPQISDGDLKKMETSLSTRFKKIAKGFGKGLGAALKGGGIAALAISLIDKLLNPLQAVNDSISKTLSDADDLVTNANQFGTTAGNLAKLQAFGESAGLDASSLNTLISKFQVAVAEAAADPSAPSAVRQFVGDKDTAESFFGFIQALKNETKSRQVLIQSQVFGEKQILKASDFLNSDFQKLSQDFSKFNTDKLTKDISKLGRLKDSEDQISAQRKLGDFGFKSAKISDSVISQRANAADIQLQKENEQIASFKALAVISETQVRIESVIQVGLLKLADLVTKLSNIESVIKKVTPGKIFRGIFGSGD